MIARSVAAALLTTLAPGQESPDPQPPSIDLLFKARSLPAVAPHTDREHLLLSGEATFAVLNRPPVKNRIQVLLAGIDRSRTSLEDRGRRNVWLLDARDSAWMRRAGESRYSEFPATNLARETATRWLLHRFPRGLDETPNRFEMREGLWVVVYTGLGVPVEVGLDRSLLPVWCTTGPQRVELDDWRPVDGGALHPHRWTWRTQGDATGRQEQFDHVRVRARFQDSTFLPPDGVPPESWLQLRTATGEQAPASTQVQMMQRAAARALVGPAGEAEKEPGWATELRAAEPGLYATGWWALLDAEGRSVRSALLLADAPPAVIPEGVRLETLEAGLYLSLTRYSAEDDSPAIAARLHRAAAQSSLAAAGAVWRWAAREGDERRHRRDYLLAIRPAEESPAPSPQGEGGEGLPKRGTTPQ